MTGPRRVTLLIEGEPTHDGRVLLPGSVHWEGDGWPLTTWKQGNGPGRTYTGILEVITDLRREDDGSITGLVHTEWTVTADLDDLDIETDAVNGTMHIHSARFRGGFAMDDGHARWPWVTPQREWPS